MVWSLKDLHILIVATRGNWGTGVEALNATVGITEIRIRGRNGITERPATSGRPLPTRFGYLRNCLLYTSDAADE